MAKPPPALQLFYPAAAFYAALALPATVFAVPAVHAQEMLFGFALAVVAGNQLGAVRGNAIVALFALWVAARAAVLLPPASPSVGPLNAAFALVLAWHVVPRLFGAAKKLRNLALPATLAALCAAAIAWQAAQGARPSRELVLASVALFALLMLFMGGRIVAPAVAGQLYRQGEPLDARVQPRLEAAILLAGAAATGALLLPGLRGIAASAAAIAGALALARLARWRLWSLRGRPDLLCLAAGYGWLGAGLIAFAAALATGKHENAALHLVTVGALGTLTFNVMAMSWMLRARREPGREPLVAWGTCLIAAATLLRILGAFHAGPWLELAAACWSVAFALLLALFRRNRPRASG